MATIMNYFAAMGTATCLALCGGLPHMSHHIETVNNTFCIEQDETEIMVTRGSICEDCGRTLSMRYIYGPWVRWSSQQCVHGYVGVQDAILLRNVYIEYYCTKCGTDTFIKTSDQRKVVCDKES